jgi:thioredoxin-related protein
MSQSWGEFADKHREAGDLNVGKVDCTSDGGKDICQDYQVQGYPTLLFFPGKDQMKDGAN